MIGDRRITFFKIFLLILFLLIGCRQGPYAIPTPTPAFVKTFPYVQETEPSTSEESNAGTTATLNLFSKECNSCHPSGESGLGPKIKNVGDRINLETFIKTVREGRNIMPAFKSDKISDNDITGLWEYLNGLQKNAATQKTADVTEKQQTVTAPTTSSSTTTTTTTTTTIAPIQSSVTAAAGGQVLFGQRCNACHPGGGAGLGPSLKNLSGIHNLASFTGVVRSGRNVMPSFQNLSDTEIAALWDYLKDLK